MGKQYFEPNKNNLNNYMLDTSAYNYIVENPETLNIIKKSIFYGFCYYSTNIQGMELSGKGAKTYNHKCIPIRMKPMEPELIEKFNFIDKELSVKLVSEVASGMRDHTRVDGTNRFVSPGSLEGIILEKISSRNKKSSNRPFAYSYDAMIAEASVHYGCILVSNDVELREIVNSFISNGAITVENLVKIINKFQIAKGQDDA